MPERRRRRWWWRRRALRQAVQAGFDILIIKGGRFAAPGAIQAERGEAAFALRNELLQGLRAGQIAARGRAEDLDAVAGDVNQTAFLRLVAEGQADVMEPAFFSNLTDELAEAGESAGQVLVNQFAIGQTGERRDGLALEVVNRNRPARL